MYGVINWGGGFVVPEAEEGAQEVTGGGTDDGASRAKGRTDGTTGEGESALGRTFGRFLRGGRRTVNNTCTLWFA